MVVQLVVRKHLATALRLVRASELKRTQHPFVKLVHFARCFGELLATVLFLADSSRLLGALETSDVLARPALNCMHDYVATPGADEVLVQLYSLVASRQNRLELVLCLRRSQAAESLGEVDKACL